MDLSVSFVDVRLFTPLDRRSKNVFHFTTRGAPHQKSAVTGVMIPEMPLNKDVR
jgi:hypothetical protein